MKHTLLSIPKDLKDKLKAIATKERNTMVKQIELWIKMYEASSVKQDA